MMDESERPISFRGFGFVPILHERDSRAHILPEFKRLLLRFFGGVAGGALL